LLSYQHGFHAGNFADVHKHLTLSFLLESLNKKNKPWCYFETHAGTAYYDLTSEQANKTAEYKEGIESIYQAPLGELFDRYLGHVKSINPDPQELNYYPGSPWIAAKESRDGDKIALMELHPTEYQLLKGRFSSNDNVAVHNRDGYEGVASLLPPKPNRGLVLIDPSYEVKSEYVQVASFIKKASQRWRNGCYAVWYPLLKSGNHREMLHKLKFAEVGPILRSEFYVKSADDQRMYGSGMLIVNPPWQLDEKLQSVSKILYKHLAEEGATQPLVDWLVAEK
jgi:23S rRNA (adenine2030-N6)-methyltransferase